MRHRSQLLVLFSLIACGQNSRDNAISFSQYRKQFEGVFKEADQDGNGYLDSNEYAKIYEGLKIDPEDASRNEIGFGYDDKNADGVVTFEEFFTDERNAFICIDSDKNNEISESETIARQASCGSARLR